MTTEKAELQQLLDLSVSRIRKQGRGSFKMVVDEEGHPTPMCIYRSPDGCGCAAEPFIVNYSPEMESKRWGRLAQPESGLLTADQKCFRTDLDPLAVKHWGFVAQLQDCHDGAVYDPSKPFLIEYEKKVQALCKRKGLTYNPPETATDAKA